MNPTSMTIASIAGAAAVLLLAPTSARAAGWEAQDGLVTEAAALPGDGTTRGALGGGGSSAGDASASMAMATVVYVPTRSVGIGLESYLEDGQPNQAASMRFQFLRQDDHGLNAVVGVRYKALSFFNKGSEVEAQLDAGRSFGAFDVLLNAVAGREVGEGGGADGEGKVYAGWRFNDRVRLGAEARYRAEIVKEQDKAAMVTPPPTDPDALGRSFDFLGGASLGVRMFDKLTVEALAGYAAPRGTNASGPAGFLLAAFDF